MQFRMFGVLCLGVLVGCGGGSSATPAAQSVVAGTSADSMARELMVDCTDDVWTVHVRAPQQVRSVEIETDLSVSFATVDYPWNQDEVDLGWGLVGHVHVARSAEDAARLAQLGVGVTNVACDAGSLPLRLSFRGDDFKELECVFVDRASGVAGCTDYGPFITRR